MKGILYGNESLSQLAKITAETFGRIPNRKVSVPAITVPAITNKEKGIIIHYVPAQPKKVLQLEFGIANNLTKFRSKTDEYINYLIGNRSHNNLADWLLNDGLAEEINVEVAPNIDRNNGIFSINVSLTDKGLENRDKIIAAIFSYIDLLKKGIKNSYFDEIAKVLNLSFQYDSIVRDMFYIQQLSNQMLNVPIAHVLYSNYVADRFDPKAISARLIELTPPNARIWFIGPNEPHHKKEAYFVNALYQVNKINPQQYKRWDELKKQCIFRYLN